MLAYYGLATSQARNCTAAQNFSYGNSSRKLGAGRAAGVFRDLRTPRREWPVQGRRRITRLTAIRKAE